MSIYIAIVSHPWITHDYGTRPEGLAAPQLELDGARPLAGRFGPIPRLEPLFPKPQV
jgi:hypothetical protein